MYMLHVPASFETPKVFAIGASIQLAGKNLVKSGHKDHSYLVIPPPGQTGENGHSLLYAFLRVLVTTHRTHVQHRSREVAWTSQGRCPPYLRRRELPPAEEHRSLRPRRVAAAPSASPLLVQPAQVRAYS